MDLIHSTFTLIDPKLQPSFEKPGGAGHDALTSAMTADVDIAVIGKADVSVVACLQFPSRPSSIRFDSRGDNGPPWAYPRRLG